MCPNAVGRPIERQNLVRRSLRRLLQRAGRPPKRFHDLRSSAGSVLLAQGVPLQEVWGLLGHSGIQITADVYRHLDAAQRRAMATRIEAALRGA